MLVLNLLKMKIRGFLPAPASVGRSQAQIVRAVRNQLVPERFPDLPVLQQKNSRHTLDIPGWNSRPMAVQPGPQHPHHIFIIHVLSQARPHQPEVFVQLAFRVPHPRHILKVMRRKVFLRSRIVCRQMHEGQLRSPLLYLFPDFTELGDRLAAERSTKIAQKDQKNGLFAGKLR